MVPSSWLVMMGRQAPKCWPEEPSFEGVFQVIFRCTDAGIKNKPYAPSVLKVARFLAKNALLINQRPHITPSYADKSEGPTFLFFFNLDMFPISGFVDMRKTFPDIF